MWSEDNSDSKKVEVDVEKESLMKNEQGSFSRRVEEPHVLLVTPHPDDSMSFVTKGLLSRQHKRMATASLVLYILAMCGLWPLQLASVAITIHLTAIGVIDARHATSATLLSVAEVLVWILFPAFGWLYVCSATGYSSTHCVYLGWIGLSVWWCMSLIIGIPRVYFTYKARNNVPRFLVAI